ncbi:unnamed protein product [Cylicocyclus nassatus]|uniref:L-Fucosyltransferase n=1 Tax=Cylicocyclus nassatus TaxID=53992 RepID=A0AA36MFS3_CYLNA|nr:unnamed protein product [Cylicocyclus nassatus]
MHLGCRRNNVAIIVLTITVIFLLYEYHYTATLHGRFLALQSNGGQVGNQLFHLCSGYAIAKKLNRRHYIRTLKADGFYIGRHIQKIEEIFPRLKNTFTVMEVGGEHREPFALTKDGKVSCCEYEDPIRLQNNTAQFLVLDFHYAQNARYFEPILPEIRSLLKFSRKVIREGKEIMKLWGVENANAVCVHIRRSDFIELNLATDLEDTVRKLRHIATITNLNEFLIFGDDADFMRRMAETLRPNLCLYQHQRPHLDGG